MEITKKGEVFKLVGTELKVGDKAPDFSLSNLADETVVLSENLTQPVIISVVPDIDTSVCSIQTKRFNTEAASIPGAKVMTVSKNTKEQQANWCAAEGVEMEMLQDTDLAFGKAYGVLIEDLGILARSIFVVSQEGTLTYMEIVPELVNEPNYEGAIAAVKTLLA